MSKIISVLLEPQEHATLPFSLHSMIGMDDTVIELAKTSFSNIPAARAAATDLITTLINGGAGNLQYTETI